MKQLILKSIILIELLVSPFIKAQDKVISTITADQEGNIFVSFDYEGILRTSDGGRSWKRIWYINSWKIKPILFNSSGDIFSGPGINR